MDCYHGAITGVVLFTVRRSIPGRVQQLRADLWENDYNVRWITQDESRISDRREMQETYVHAMSTWIARIISLGRLMTDGERWTEGFSLVFQPAYKRCQYIKHAHVRFLTGLSGIKYTEEIRMQSGWLTWLAAHNLKARNVWNVHLANHGLANTETEPRSGRRNRNNARNLAEEIYNAGDGFTARRLEEAVERRGRKREIWEWEWGWNEGAAGAYLVRYAGCVNVIIPQILKGELSHARAEQEGRDRDE